MDAIMDLLEYWETSPPVHVIEAVKAGLGKKRRKPTPEEQRLREFESPRALKKPEELTPEEEAIEAQLPDAVREFRAKRREERRKQWLTTQSQSGS